MNTPLAGQNALVTGASRGIGRAVALELAGLGADVAITARTAGTSAGQPETLRATAEEVEALGVRVVPIVADLAQPEEVARVASEVLDAFGHLDILVNNAAFLGDDMYASFWNVGPDVWRQQFDVNVHAPYMLMQALVPSMVERGKGLVVNFTSGSADMRDVPQPLPGRGGTGAGYGATKAAVNRMSNAVGNELHAQGITVVALNPGSTLTENYPRVAERYGFDVSKTHPTRVPARVVSYLAQHADPLRYTGTVLVARDFAIEHDLMDTPVP